WYSIEISKKMRILIISTLLFISIGCEKQDTFKIIKNNFLYIDNKDNIYLKEKIDIASEKYPQNNKTVYLDAVLYKDKVLKLKQLVDTATFHQIGTKDSKDIFVKGIYKDKKHIYIFRNYPASYPNIWASDK
ncbi:hypothetical protein, partial [Cloacibacterium rupense]|uniref:hypothetical protein n=1 Tax=Cloacibacterium rupense TaxID=517423 RepID=UPI001E2EC3FC